MTYKKRLRERERRAEAGKDAGSIATDNSQKDLLKKPNCLQRVSRCLGKFSA